MTELRQHRDITEKVMGMVLAGIIEPDDVAEEMLLYPHNAALIDRRAGATIAKLMTTYGTDAINAATEAAKQLNGVSPKQHLDELARIYKNFKIVNVAQRTIRQIEKDEEVDFTDLLNEIDRRLESGKLQPMSWDDIKGEFDQEWLWAGWIPHGEATILVGDQGAGKSAFALYFADCVANGKPLPDGSVVGETRGVLWVETEGRAAENFRRADLWGLDKRNLYSPTIDLRRVLDLNTPEDMQVIRQHAMRPEVGLVVIDSLGGALMEENDASAKRILQRMSKMAQEADTSFLIIHHLRKRNPNAKGTQRITLQDVRGHTGITQFSPSVIAIDYEGNEMPRYLTPLKMNLVSPPSTIAFSIGVMGLIWDDKSEDKLQRAIIEEMVVWLEDLLASGPMLTGKVREAAEKAGYSLELLKRTTNYPSIGIVEIGGERCFAIK
jgi:hypothetical protein